MDKQNIIQYLKKFPNAFIELDNDTYTIFENEELAHEDGYVSIYSEDIKSDLPEGVYKVELIKALCELTTLNISAEVV